MSTSTYTGWHDDRLPGLGFLGIVVFVFSARHDDVSQERKERWALCAYKLQKQPKKYPPVRFSVPFAALRIFIVCSLNFPQNLP